MLCTPVMHTDTDGAPSSCSVSITCMFLLVFLKRTDKLEASTHQMCLKYFNMLIGHEHLQIEERYHTAKKCHFYFLAQVSTS